jgi:TorA maturation chaperone TorD
MRLTPGDEARARSYGYTLFARLLLEGVTADLLPTIRAVPELADLLPESVDLDEAAAIHNRLFAFNVFPYAGIFLDDSGLLGGPAAGEVERLYRQAGFEIDVSGAGADHLGQELAFLTYLATAESDAWADNNVSAVQSWQAAQYKFLKNHLLPWLTPCLIAIELQEDEFYRRIAQIVMALSAGHYEALTIAGSLPENETSFITLPVQQPTAGQSLSLEDGRTGLREIARFLITPSQAGIFLGRHDLNLLARRLSLPHGFGSREQMLMNLLQSAGQYDSALPLFQTLQERVTIWQERYQRVQSEFPQTAVFVQPWQKRTSQGQHLITCLINEIEQR